MAFALALCTKYDQFCMCTFIQYPSEIDTGFLSRASPRECQKICWDMFEFFLHLYYVFQPFFCLLLLPKITTYTHVRLDEHTVLRGFCALLNAPPFPPFSYKTELPNKVHYKIVLTDQKYFGSFKNFINLAQFSSF